eukprot:2135237-Pyramimonas_sp.AAC.1
MGPELATGKFQDPERLDLGAPPPPRIDGTAVMAVRFTVFMKVPFSAAAWPACSRRKESFIVCMGLSTRAQNP